MNIKIVLFSLFVLFSEITFSQDFKFGIEGGLNSSSFYQIQHLGMNSLLLISKKDFTGQSIEPRYNLGFDLGSFVDKSFWLWFKISAKKIVF